ncbi:oligoendopeptidase F [Tepiditoga spiralis]|uniref:Oligoendopeptidase F n=1 Tax=Tepiditoga spiralis TaxID=2108365 RepID=A0A7G1G362_9BACT|nr:M3 family oligoendopeptidase [Tepiditoga spiralis]BBE30801.1 oligoendopeptidase F [Tepiditoga spiralis]
MNWDLTFFYESPSSKKIKKDLDEFLNMAQELKNEYYNKLGNENLSPIELKIFFNKLEEFEQKGYYPSQYSNLLFASNTLDQEAQKLRAMVQDYFTKASIITSFWSPVLLKLSEEKLTELKESKELIQYKHVMEKLVDSKKHTLSEEAEKVMTALSSSSREAFGDLYGRLTNSYEFKFRIGEEVKTITGPQLRSMRLNPDPDIRSRAMKMFFERYEKDKITLEHTYNSIVKHYDTESKLRNFPEPNSMKNLKNEVNDEIVKMVMGVTTEKTPIVHSYYEWKAKQLKTDITLADIYAPLKSVNKEYDFESAKKIVLDSYYQFDKEFGDIAKSFFDENRIDSEIRKGKRGGAFCSYYIPNKKPFVLINYTGNMRDIMTLAHELGHGIHGTLSSKQNLLNYHTPLTMAEVASVFGEMLVMDKLLNELNEEDKKLFIASKIEDMFATMFRQNMFARFEVQAHKMIEENGMASWEELSDLYERELKIMFGNSVKITPEYKYEWASIPHIFNVPFYVYAYNYANLLVIALYEKYLEEGKDFVPKYKELLSSGGNDYPNILLEKLGIDITKKEFWEKGFDYVEKLIKEIM